MSGPDLPTGRQLRLARDGSHGPVTATVTELAASLRALRVGGVPLVEEYDDRLPPPGGAGIVLVPWPNRVAGARWRLDGQQQRLDVTEPETGNASHGLLRNTGYTDCAERVGSAATLPASDSVTLAAGIFPQHGWPFRLDTAVRYALTDDGIEVTHTIRNRSGRAAPVAVGAHPYLCVGDTDVEDLTLTVAADTWVEVDERQIPVATHPVAGSPYDLRDGATLRGRVLDTAFTGLTQEDGLHRHRLTAPDGRACELWAEPAFRWVQVYTKPSFPTRHGDRRAVAVEPMTAPADALNSGTDLRWLDPGAQWQLRWGIRRLS